MLIFNRKVGQAIVVDLGDGDRGIRIRRGELVSEPVVGRARP